MFTQLMENKHNFLTKLNSFFSYDEKVKLTRAMAVLMTSVGSMQMCALAAGGADAMFGTLIGYVCKIFFYIGTILLVWAVGQLVLAFKNEDADSKSRAVMVLVCAVLLMSIGAIYDNVSKNMEGAIGRDTSVSL